MKLNMFRFDLFVVINLMVKAVENALKFSN
jgi:hypothetical protein